MQHVPGDLALDQVVLRASPDRLLAKVLVGDPGEHDDGHRGLPREQPAKTVKILGVGQA